MVGSDNFCKSGSEIFCLGDNPNACFRPEPASDDAPDIARGRRMIFVFALLSPVRRGGRSQGRSDYCNCKRKTVVHVAYRFLSLAREIGDDGAAVAVGD